MVDAAELANLLEEAQEELILSEGVFSTQDAMGWIEAKSGAPLSADDRRCIIGNLQSHPRLVPGAVGSGETMLWKRGRNTGLPKRNPISSR